jgi:hypothetical protein
VSNDRAIVPNGKLSNNGQLLLDRGLCESFGATELSKPERAERARNRLDRLVQELSDDGGS